jgi:preprotein translocase subunit YajC
MKVVIATLMVVLLVAAGVAGPTSAQQVDEKSWQKIHGKIDKIEGTTLTLKTDDGKTVTVDMAQVGEDIRKSLTKDERVTVTGFYRRDQNHVAAQYVQKDSSDVSRGGTVAGQASPATTVDEKSWQKIHGKVDKVEGTTLTLKADDGKTLTVDMAKVSESIRQALTKDEGVTITGFYKGDQNHVTAQFIQQDSSDPSRGGKVTTPSASPSTK